VVKVVQIILPAKLPKLAYETLSIAELDYSPCPIMLVDFPVDNYTEYINSIPAYIATEFSIKLLSEGFKVNSSIYEDDKRCIWLTKNETFSYFEVSEFIKQFTTARLKRKLKMTNTIQSKPVNYIRLKYIDVIPPGKRERKINTILDYHDDRHWARRMYYNAA